MLVFIRKSLLISLFITSLNALSITAQDRCIVTLQSSVTSQSGTRITHREAYVFESVDQPPYFPGGDGALVRYINNQRRYPIDAYNAGIEGRVVCSFIVNPKGNIEDVGIVRGVEPSLDAEAIRVIEQMPKWVAGRIADNPVPVYCILTIPFRK